MNKKKPRPVYIVPNYKKSGALDGFFVVYADRVKHGHHYAAQFCYEFDVDCFHDEAWVREWVNNHPKLELVENPNT